MKVDVIIPVYKPNQEFLTLLEMLQEQTYPIHEIILMNTEKSYYDAFETAYPKIKEMSNVKVYHVTKEEFDHGKTRNIGVAHSKADIFVMMTNDAIPADTALIENLVKGLSDENTAACYARQLPKASSGPLEVFQRGFNYPDVSVIKTEKEIATLGIKAFFCSNVCCAYKRALFDELGGFVNRAIFNEDMIYAHQVLMHGYAICYQAQARVYHSHDYGCMQQFHRNFDLGVSQAMHPEVFEGVPSESEGIKSVKKAAAYLWSEHKPYLIPKLVILSGFKFIGYKMGKKYQKLSPKMIMACTMNKEFWKS